MTRHQKEVFDFIHEYLRVEGISPTYKEIKDYCELSAISHAHKIVMALVRDKKLALARTGVRKIHIMQ
tara:strand:+ start:495 stop:698 length:204 start_codon:yes stop_codon:yes gene_type:complete